MNVARLFEQIEHCYAEGGDWCTSEKAHTLAALVLSTRPARVVEIGVWLGGSLVPMLLALRELGCGKATAIDPWQASASAQGEDGANAAWWGKVDHEAIYRRFLARLDKHELEPFCDVVRMRSDDAPIVRDVGILHIDGNHREQALRDVSRYGTHVVVGGFLVLDDVSWEGGHVSKALALAKAGGFEERYPLGTGVVLQRVRWPA